MTAVLGIDTSNYTTSAAVLSRPGGLDERRRPLKVAAGNLGLRQSEAVFQHVRALPEMLEALPICGVRAVGASVCPGGRPGSYMPCFKVGEGAARTAAAAAGVPFYGFTHQAGHIAAALFSAGRLELLDSPLIAFHVSGGTTEAVLAEPDPDAVFRCRAVSRSLDLNAGQAVDRVGVLLGLRFPCGPALEALAARSEKRFDPKPVFRGGDFSLSGVQNRCGAMLENGALPEDVAAYCLKFIGVTLAQAARRLSGQYPGLPLVFAGGVMSDLLIRADVAAACGALFAKPGFSSDNAAGVAALAMRRLGRRSE